MEPSPDQLFQQQQQQQQPVNTQIMSEVTTYDLNETAANTTCQ